MNGMDSELFFQHFLDDQQVLNNDDYKHYEKQEYFHFYFLLKVKADHLQLWAKRLLNFLIHEQNQQKPTFNSFRN